MSNLPRVYDVGRVTQTLGGATITGFAEGSKVTITKADAVTSTSRGIDGTDITINLVNMKDGTVSFNLMRNSEFNKSMMAWHNAYIQKVGPYYLPYQLEDPSGYSLNTVAWLETQPDYEAAQETGEVTWVLHVQDANMQPSQSAATAAFTSIFTGVTLGSIL